MDTDTQFILDIANANNRMFQKGIEEGKKIAYREISEEKIAKAIYLEIEPDLNMKQAEKLAKAIVKELDRG